MDGDKRADIQTEASVKGIQPEKPLPTREATGNFRVGGSAQTGILSERTYCVLSVLLLVLPPLAIAGYFYYLSWRDDAALPKAEQMMARGGPGIGATRGEVEAWLDRQGIPHWRMKSLNDSGGYPAKPPSKFGGLVPGIGDGYIVGKAYSPRWIGGGEIWIYFFFESDGRLVQHVIKKWVAWP